MKWLGLHHNLRPMKLQLGIDFNQNGLIAIKSILFDKQFIVTYEIVTTDLEKCYCDREGGWLTYLVRYKTKRVTGNIKTHNENVRISKRQNKSSAEVSAWDSPKALTKPFFHWGHLILDSVKNCCEFTWNKNNCCVVHGTTTEHCIQHFLHNYADTTDQTKWFVASNLIAPMKYNRKLAEGYYWASCTEM